MKSTILIFLSMLAICILNAGSAESAEFNVNNTQYRSILDMMHEKNIMTEYTSKCSQEASDSYICTINGEGMLIITYAPNEKGNLTTITFAATSNTVDRVSSLAAIASLSLDQKFLALEDQQQGVAMVKKEKDAIEKTMASIIVRGGNDDMELTPGGERFYYQLKPGQAAVRVVPRDWE